MTVSSQICKRIYQADGQNRQWAVDFAYLSGNELKVYVTDASGAETDVTAHCMWDEVEHEMIYPTVESEQDPLPVGSTVTILRVTTPTQSLHLTQQGTLDAAALEGGFDKLTLHVQELAEQARRSIKYPVSSSKTDVDAQAFLAQLQSTQTVALNSALESVAATKIQLQQTILDEQTARQQADGELQSALAAKQNTLNADGQEAVTSGINAAKVASYDAHLLSTRNPHNVTKTQVGLANVDNTADLDKPISTAVQIALNAKQPVGDYATSAALSAGLATKQNVLTSAQQAAVDSGITSADVAQVQVNKEDIATLDAELDEKREWQKPADWIDISSGAINNSIYLLVGHPADYSSLNNLGFAVALNDDTHNFNVYIDNIFYQTYQSGSTVAISWSDLALTTGENTTFPIDLTTHIVRITPENNSDTIYSYQQARVNASSGEQQQGVLWGHFAVDYALDRVRFASYNNCYNYYLVAVTALGDNLHISGNYIDNLFGETYDRVNHKSHYLSYIPTIEVDTIASWGGAFNNAGPLKKVRLKVNTKIQQIGAGNSQYAFVGDIRKLEINKPILLSNRNSSVRLFANSSLERLPAFDATNMVVGADFLTNNSNLKDTILDFSNAKNLTILTLYGTESNRMDGLKGVFVSDQAPFNRTTSPQLNVAYTGMDRNALVNLFKSMPAVSDNQVCNVTGCTGAADLTAEDLAIATDKGWTITR